MGISGEQVSQDQLGLFDIQTTVTFGSTDPTAQPQFDYHYGPAGLPPNTASQIEIAESGIATSVYERARILGELVLPLLAGIAQRDGLQDAVHTATPPLISHQGVRQAAANAQDMKRTTWNILHAALGYEAAASHMGAVSSAQRLVNEDLATLQSRYGRGQSKARKAFQKLLQQQRP